MSKKHLILLLALCLGSLARAQTERGALRDSISAVERAVQGLKRRLSEREALLKRLRAARPLKRWKIKGTQRITFDQAAFSHWVGGGNDAIALSAQLDYRFGYRRGIQDWESRIDLGYGLRDAAGEGSRKTADELHLSSRYNCRYAKRWTLGEFLDFRTQFDKGYNYEVSSTDYISKFMAPGYLKTGPTLSYSPTADFYLSLSPAALKFNFVLDRTLSERGTYGVKPGRAVFTQFGADLSTYYRLVLLKRVSVENRFSLYADYLRQLGNVDVNYNMLLKLRIDKYLSTVFRLGLVYDDDAKVEIAKRGTEVIYGKRLQLRQSLGVGLVYVFSN